MPDAIRAAKRGRTNAVVVYDAIESCLSKLPDLLASRRATQSGPDSGSLFIRQAADAHEDTRIPWTFKATEANRAVLDSLVDRLRAHSRSELVSTALEHTFPAP